MTHDRISNRSSIGLGSVVGVGLPLGWPTVAEVPISGVQAHCLGMRRSRTRWQPTSLRPEYRIGAMVISVSVHLGYVFLFVEDVVAATSFYERAFGLACRYLDAEGMFSELDTGATILSFAQDDFASEANGIQHRRNALDHEAPGVSFTFVSDDVAADWNRAVEAGAIPVELPTAKPWGQLVGYLRDPHGFIVEVASAVDYGHA